MCATKTQLDISFLFDVVSIDLNQNPKIRFTFVVGLLCIILIVDILKSDTRYSPTLVKILFLDQQFMILK